MSTSIFSVRTTSAILEHNKTNNNECNGAAAAGAITVNVSRSLLTGNLLALIAAGVTIHPKTGVVGESHSIRNAAERFMLFSLISRPLGLVAAKNTQQGAVSNMLRAMHTRISNISWNGQAGITKEERSDTVKQLLTLFEEYRGYLDSSAGARDKIRFAALVHRLGVTDDDPDQKKLNEKIINIDPEKIVDVCMGRDGLNLTAVETMVFMQRHGIPPLKTHQKFLREDVAGYADQNAITKAKIFKTAYNKTKALITTSNYDQNANAKEVCQALFGDKIHYGAFIFGVLSDAGFDEDEVHNALIAAELKVSYSLNSLGGDNVWAAKLYKDLTLEQQAKIKKDAVDQAIENMYKTSLFPSHFYDKTSVQNSNTTVQMSKNSNIPEERVNLQYAKNNPLQYPEFYPSFDPNLNPKEFMKSVSALHNHISNTGVGLTKKEEQVTILNMERFYEANNNETGYFRTPKAKDDKIILGMLLQRLGYKMSKSSKFQLSTLQASDIIQIGNKLKLRAVEMAYFMAECYVEKYRQSGIFGTLGIHQDLMTSNFDGYADATPADKVAVLRSTGMRDIILESSIYTEEVKAVVSGLLSNSDLSSKNKIDTLKDKCRFFVSSVSSHAKLGIEDKVHILFEIYKAFKSAVYDSKLGDIEKITMFTQGVYSAVISTVLGQDPITIKDILLAADTNGTSILFKGLGSNDGELEGMIKILVSDVLASSSLSLDIKIDIIINSCNLANKLKNGNRDMSFVAAEAISRSGVQEYDARLINRMIKLKENGAWKISIGQDSSIYTEEVKAVVSGLLSDSDLSSKNKIDNLKDKCRFFVSIVSSHAKLEIEDKVHILFEIYQAFKSAVYDSKLGDIEKITMFTQGVYSAFISTVLGQNPIIIKDILLAADTNGTSILFKGLGSNDGELEGMIKILVSDVLASSSLSLDIKIDIIINSCNLANKLKNGNRDMSFVAAEAISRSGVQEYDARLRNLMIKLKENGAWEIGVNPRLLDLLEHQI